MKGDVFYKVRVDLLTVLLIIETDSKEESGIKTNM